MYDRNELNKMVEKAGSVEIYEAEREENLGRFHTDFIGCFFGDNLDDVPVEAAEIRAEIMTPEEYCNTVAGNSDLTADQIDDETTLVIQFYVSKPYRAAVNDFCVDTDAHTAVEAWREIKGAGTEALLPNWEGEWEYFETFAEAEEFAARRNRWQGIQNGLAQGTATVVESWNAVDDQWELDEIILPAEPRLTVQDVTCRLEPGKMYAHRGSGAIASAEDWCETIEKLDDEDAIFDPEQEFPLVEVAE